MYKVTGYPTFCCTFCEVAPDVAYHQTLYKILNCSCLFIN